MQVRHVRHRTDRKCVQRDHGNDEAVIPELSASAAFPAGNPLIGPPLELNHESNHLYRRTRRHRLVYCRVLRPALRAEQGRTGQCCAVIHDGPIWLVRSRDTVGEVSLIRTMIPGHSTAVPPTRERRPRIRALAI